MSMVGGFGHRFLKGLWHLYNSVSLRFKLASGSAANLR